MPIMTGMHVGESSGGLSLVVFTHCGRGRSSEREVRRCFGFAMSDPQLVSSLPVNAARSLPVSNDSLDIEHYPQQ